MTRRLRRRRKPRRKVPGVAPRGDSEAHTGAWVDVGAILGGLQDGEVAGPQHGCSAVVPEATNESPG